LQGERGCKINYNNNSFPLKSKINYCSPFSPTGREDSGERGKRKRLIVNYNNNNNSFPLKSKTYYNAAPFSPSGREDSGERVIKGREN